MNSKAKNNDQIIVKINKTTYTAIRCVVYGMFFISIGYLIHLFALNMWVQSLNTSIEKKISSSKEHKSSLNLFTPTNKSLSQDSNFSRDPYFFEVDFNESVLAGIKNKYNSQYLTNNTLW